ncbi:caspase family protein [Streptomyces sp. NBC_00124]|uniref:caspase, EACC1-associated type n=1 Tax=Streptomyces sp. NBC_00124 TaxID=2975662 RepID=UPI00225BC82D|nr:caspase family protein [Streptomyces sp. NBC_00124]MCX5357320.1 caspase family protein [Streptomyces sp. NBC_00124]
MDHLPRPERSRAVLVGAGRFSRLDDLPAVQANVPALRALLCGTDTPFRTENCVSLVDPATTVEVSKAVQKAAREATDTLLIYYAGHGLLDDKGELHLAVPQSDNTSVYDTAVPYDWIRRPIASTGAARRVVILDCCYSARAFGVQSESVIDLADVDGTYVMAAAGETAVALSPPGETFTAFTAALIETLAGGVPGAGELLDLSTVFRHVRGRLKGRGRPTPLDLDRNGLGATPFIRNSAYVPAAPPPDADHGMLHLLESTPRTATVTQLVASVGLLSEHRSATAGDLVRTALQVRAVAELAPFLAALFEAGHRAPAESALPTLLLTRPVEETAHLVDLLHAMSSDECVVSLLRLSIRLQPAQQAAQFASALYRSSLVEHARAVLTGFALTRELAETIHLMQAMEHGESARLLSEVTRSVAEGRAISDVTSLYLLLYDSMPHAAELLVPVVAEKRAAVDAAEMISVFQRQGHQDEARQILAAGMSRRGPRYLAELVAALQSARLADAAATARFLAVEHWPAEDISRFIAHLLAVGQHQHALAAAVDTARLRTVAEFASITSDLNELLADQAIDALLDNAARACSPVEAAYLVNRLDAAGQDVLADRIFWLSLLRPVGHAADMLGHLDQAASRFLSAAELSGLWQTRPLSDVARFAVALERSLPYKSELLLNVTERPVHQVAAMVESLEKTAANALSNKVLREVVTDWGMAAQAQLVIALEERSQTGCARYLEERASRTRGFSDALRTLRTQPKAPEPWWPRKRSEYQPSRHTHVMYLVKADETLQHIAKRFGVRPAGIIDGNNLRAPYTIHEGQTLSIPLQSDGRRFMLPPFPRRLAPGRIDPDTRRLQRLLKQTGYLDPSIAESDHYGPQTCQAVARLNREHLLGQSPAPDDDPRITHKAWDILHRLAKGTESP